MANPAKAGFNQKAANRWTARIIPIILIGIVGYVTWVIIVLVSVDYLLRPSTLPPRPRPRSATAVIVLYSVLLFFIAITYFRLLYTVTTNPGYIPRGPQWYTVHEGHTRRGGSGLSNQKTHKDTIKEKTHRNRNENSITAKNLGNFPYGTEPRPNAVDEVSPDLQDIYGRDIFTCEGNGKPIWCSSCCNWKPDRAHHCSEVDRCVRKMDHFCPWVGGVMGETTFKFFLQFVAWTALYCVFTLILTAKVISEQRKDNKAVNVHWIVTICLAAMFGLFTLGMTGSSLQFVLLNSTTIENLSRHNKVWLLAIHIARPPNPPVAAGFSTITYPLADASSVQHVSDPIKSFAILHSKPGDNPWSLGLFKNFKTVMGEHWYDWIVPIKYSPCCNHDRGDCQFSFGPVVRRICEEAGIASPDYSITNKGSEGQPRRQRRRHKRPKRSEKGDADGSQSENDRRRASKSRQYRSNNGNKPDIPGTELNNIDVH